MSVAAVVEGVIAAHIEGHRAILRHAGGGGVFLNHAVEQMLRGARSAPGRRELEATAVRAARAVGVDRHKDVGIVGGRHGGGNEIDQQAATFEQLDDAIRHVQVDIGLGVAAGKCAR